MSVEDKVLIGGIVFTKIGEDILRGSTTRVTEYGKTHKTGEKAVYGVSVRREIGPGEEKEGEVTKTVEYWRFSISRSWASKQLRMEGPRTYPSAEIAVDAATSFVDGWHEANGGS